MYTQFEIFQANSELHEPIYVGLIGLLGYVPLGQFDSFQNRMETKSQPSQSV